MPLEKRETLEEKTIDCYERLMFTRDYGIFAQIAELNGESAMLEQGIKPVVKTYPLPPNLFLQIYKDKGLKKTRQNSYGEEMVYTFAENMQRLKLPKDASAKNKAIMAYIKALKPDTPIILNWC